MLKRDCNNVVCIDLTDFFMFEHFKQIRIKKDHKQIKTIELNLFYIYKTVNKTLNFMKKTFLQKLFSKQPKKGRKT